MKLGADAYRKQRAAQMATRLQSARVRAGWTQEQVANYLGFSRAHINRVEQGRAQLGIADVELLAEVLHVPLAQLLELPP